MKGSNFSFLIPLRIESEDRLRNLRICVRYLKKHLPKCTIYIKESDLVSKFPDDLKRHVIYEFEQSISDVFHRTRLLNEMLFKVTTPIVSNFDVDVIVPPNSFREIEKMILKENHDLVYPYGEGPYLWLAHLDRCPKFIETLSIADLKYLTPSGTGKGHAHFLRTESLRKGFMINENFISYGPEDEEFFVRFEKLGFKIGRVENSIYHVEHSRTPNSSTANLFFQHNQHLYGRINEMTKTELHIHMSSQPYLQKYKQINNMKTALVFGAGGFIGSHLVKRLKSEGFWVRGVDLKLPEYSQTAADDFIVGDLRDKSIVSRAMYAPNQKSTQDRENSFDEVYQLAADMGGAAYVFGEGEHDADIMYNSMQINLNAVREAVDKNVKKIFYSSSACIYPEFNQLDPDNPNCEESSAYPAKPDSEYGWEKIFSERMYFAHHRNFGLDIRIARFHNIFGPEGTWTGGKEKAPAAISRKVAEAADGGTIEIWGDGKQTRSFLYIDECLDGIRKLMDSEFIGPINIGSEEMIAINNLAEMVIELSGKKVSINNISGPTGVRGRNSDNRLCREILKWEPSQKLVEGMKKTYTWVNEQVHTL